MRKPALSIFILVLLLCAGSVFESGNVKAESNPGCPGTEILVQGKDSCRNCHVLEPDQNFQTRSEECDFCHGGGIGSNLSVRMEDVRFANTGHRLGFTGYAPDTDKETPYAVVGFSCIDCHASHNSREKVIGSYYDRSLTNSKDIRTSGNSQLLGQPNPANTGDHNYEGRDIALTDWCSSCHEGNGAIGRGGSSKDHRYSTVAYNEVADTWERVYSHDSSGEGYVKGGQKYHYDGTMGTDASYAKVKPEDDINQGPTCYQCHSRSSFPHTGSGLPYKGTATAAIPDGFCLECHKSDALP